MKQRILEYLRSLPTRKAIIAGLVFGVLVEMITCVARFGFHMESTRDTAFLAPFTLGYRIHHGYIGVLILLALFFLSGKAIRNLAIIIGLSLLMSDMVHHFIVLWIFTGSPHFDIHY